MVNVDEFHVSPTACFIGGGEWEKKKGSRALQSSKHAVHLSAHFPGWLTKAPFYLRKKKLIKRNKNRERHFKIYDYTI
jgi:hypothetical protein